MVQARKMSESGSFCYALKEDKRVKKQLGASAAETSLAVSNLSATMGKLVEFLSPDAAGNNGQQDSHRLTALEKKVDEQGSKLDQILAAMLQR